MSGITLFQTATSLKLSLMKDKIYGTYLKHLFYADCKIMVFFYIKNKKQKVINTDDLFGWLDWNNIWSADRFLP